MGGFASGPGGVIAWLLRRPLLIHEQNSVAGTTNRLLAPLARTVMVAFPGSLPAARRPVHTGNPVRGRITSLPAPATRLAQRSGPLRLLVVGGSLGARVLNDTVPAAIAQTGHALEIYHQTGRDGLEQVVSAYKNTNVEARDESVVEIEQCDAHWMTPCRKRRKAYTNGIDSHAGLPP